jgi:hypothetical protein
MAQPTDKSLVSEGPYSEGSSFMLSSSITAQQPIFSASGNYLVQIEFSEDLAPPFSSMDRSFDEGDKDLWACKISRKKSIESNSSIVSESVHEAFPEMNYECSMTKHDSISLSDIIGKFHHRLDFKIRFP